MFNLWNVKTVLSAYTAISISVLGRLHVCSTGWVYSLHCIGLCRWFRQYWKSSTCIIWLLHNRSLVSHLHTIHKTAPLSRLCLVDTHRVKANVKILALSLFSIACIFIDNIWHLSQIYQLNDKLNLDVVVSWISSSLLNAWHQYQFPSMLSTIPLPSIIQWKPYQSVWCIDWVWWAICFLTHLHYVYQIIAFMLSGYLNIFENFQSYFHVQFDFGLFISY